MTLQPDAGLMTVCRCIFAVSTEHPFGNPTPTVCEINTTPLISLTAAYLHWLFDVQVDKIFFLGLHAVILSIVKSLSNLMEAEVSPDAVDNILSIFLKGNTYLNLFK
jgi:hypothetical protein